MDRFGGTREDDEEEKRWGVHYSVCASTESVRRTGLENVLGPKDTIHESNRLLAPAV